MSASGCQLRGGFMANGDNYVFKLDLKDYSEQIMQLEEEGVEALLEAIGLQAEGDVVIKISSRSWKPKAPIDTSRLKNSITHRVVTSEKAVYIGTNVKYAPYVEFGTGDMGTGTGKKWTYRDDEGKFHKTSGMAPRPFLKTALKEHMNTYKWIAEDALFEAFQ